MAFTIQPAVGKGFINREEELQDILTTLKDRESTIGFALMGKRRMGKTSIFKETERLLKREKNIVPLYFSMWDLVENNLTEFARELSLAIIEAYRPYLGLKYRARELMELPFNFLKKLIGGLKISIELKDSISFLLSFEKEKKIDFAGLITETFNLSEELARATNIKCVIFLDEFPEVINLRMNGKKVGEDIIKKIRTIQEGYRKTSFNISGSIRKAMEIACLSPSSAFYRQFVVKQIGPLTKQSIASLVRRNLKGKTLTKDGIELFYKFTRGIPFYAQFMGRLLSQYTGQSLGREEVGETIDEFLKQEGNLLFKEEFERLSDKEKVIVVAMATKRIFTFSEIFRELRAKVTNVARFLGYLEEKAVVEKRDKGEYDFSDPIFREWLVRR